MKPGARDEAEGKWHKVKGKGRIRSNTVIGIIVAWIFTGRSNSFIIP